MKGGGLGGRVTFHVSAFAMDGVFQFADAPAQAPVVHLGGPLQITFYGQAPTLRLGRSTDLVLAVGTPGIGPGAFAMIGYQDTIPESAKPSAQITLPPAKPGAAPVKENFEIKHRC